VVSTIASLTATAHETRRRAVLVELQSRGHTVATGGPSFYKMPVFSG